MIRKCTRIRRPPLAQDHVIGEVFQVSLSCRGCSKVGGHDGVVCDRNDGSVNFGYGTIIVFPLSTIDVTARAKVVCTALST